MTRVKFQQGQGRVRGHQGYVTPKKNHKLSKVERENEALRQRQAAARARRTT